MLTLHRPGPAGVTLNPLVISPRAADPTPLSDISRRVLIKSRVFSLPREKKQKKKT